jgi:hypothetical protein
MTMEGSQPRPHTLTHLGAEHRCVILHDLLHAAPDLCCPKVAIGVSQLIKA